MAEFIFKGNTKVTFIPQPGILAEARPMTEEEQACDCGCMDVQRTPAADLTFYREEQRPAGVSPGYLVLSRFGQAVEVANIAMLHDGEGNWVGDIEPDSWRRVELEGDR